MITRIYGHPYPVSRILTFAFILNFILKDYHFLCATTIPITIQLHTKVDTQACSTTELMMIRLAMGATDRRVDPSPILCRPEMQVGMAIDQKH